MSEAEQSNPAIRPRHKLVALSNSPVLQALRRREVQVGLALALLTVVAFAPACSCDYVNYDDPEYVLGRNVHTQEGLNPDVIIDSFTTLGAGYWQPLTWISFALDAQF